MNECSEVANLLFGLVIGGLIAIPFAHSAWRWRRAAEKAWQEADLQAELRLDTYRRMDEWRERCFGAELRNALDVAALIKERAE